MGEIVNDLKQKGFSLEGKQIFYFSGEGKIYVNCGVDPIHPDISVTYDEIEKDFSVF